MAEKQAMTNWQTMSSRTQDAGRIAALRHAGASAIARQELERFLALVESLSGDDWQQPTDCTLWNVRDMLAHQAGAYAGGASLAEFRHQRSNKPGPGQLRVDAANAQQLADRAGRSPAELISELRRAGPAAIRARQNLPWLLRKIPIPMPQPEGPQPVEYLTDLIYPRDTWMHRADICRATGRPFEQTAEHDGRVVALVLRDIARRLEARLRGQSVVFELESAAGGSYRIGRAVEPTAIIKMDVLQFNRMASGRITVESARAQSLIAISGDRGFADEVLAQTRALY